MPHTAAVLRPDYVLTRLDHSHVPAMVALQSEIMAQLGQGHRHFIIPKLEARFAIFTEAPHMAFGAVTLGDSLAAMGLVGVPNVLEPAAGPDCGLVQSIFVHHDWRKRGLMDQLLQGIETCAIADGLTMLNSRIAADNLPSRRGFERNGYLQYGHDKRDLDGTPLLLFKKALVDHASEKLRAL